MAACMSRQNKKKKIYISDTVAMQLGHNHYFFLKKILIIRHNQCCWLMLNQIRSSLLNSIDLLSWLIIKSALRLAADWIWSICWSVGWLVSLSHTCTGMTYHDCPELIPVSDFCFLLTLVFCLLTNTFLYQLYCLKRGGNSVISYDFFEMCSLRFHLKKKKMFAIKKNLTKR